MMVLPIKNIVAIAIAFTISLVVAQQLEKAGPCEEAKCKLPNCKCASTTIPGGLKKDDTPQFVLLTFDDAVTVSNIEYYRKALFSRKNPNGCPVAATFFTSHEYTDYSLVQELHSKGQEIALHSISHQPNTTYWRELTVDTLTKEFAGERQIISKFANISAQEIKGLRLPLLQMSGDQSFVMMQKNNFLYDCSWTTQSYTENGLWPYTTDNATIQDCMIGPCPTSKIPGVWVVPMIDWKDRKGNVCAMVDTCVDIPTKEDELVQYMIDQFNKTFHGSRAPFGVYLHSAWFAAVETHFPAYLKFLDYLQKLPQVYMINAAKLIDWVKTPVTLQNIKNSPWGKCQNTYTPTCKPSLCKLMKEETEERWMTSCAEKCPSVYPWLGTPLGEK